MAEVVDTVAQVLMAAEVAAQAVVVIDIAALVVVVAANAKIGRTTKLPRLAT